jgi:NitT/TauT family transport system substrate-binding protein
MKTRFVVGLCVAVVAAALSSVPAMAQTKVVMAYVPVADFTPLFVAKEMGYFEKQGIAAELVSIPVAPMAPAAITAGSVQIGMTTPPIYLQARSGGLDLEIVSALSWESKANPQMSLIARKGAGITDAKSFEGKKVGVPGLQSLADLVTRKWLKDHGANLAKISFVEVAMPQLIDAMRGSTVDAVAAIEPIGSAAVASGTGELVARQLVDLHDGAVLTFWIANGDWAKANAPAVKGFRTAMAEALVYIKDNTAEAKKIAFKYIKREPATFPTWNPELKASDLAFHESMTRELGFLTADVNLKNIILP